jgi:hypothetical protein
MCELSNVQIRTQGQENVGVVKNCRKTFYSSSAHVKIKMSVLLTRSGRWFSKDPSGNPLETHLQIFVFTYGYVLRCWLHDDENSTTIAVRVLELFGSQSLIFCFEIDSSRANKNSIYLLLPAEEHPLCSVSLRWEY